MTKITLTEEMKLKALEQYHPHITISLWCEIQNMVYKDNVNLKILLDDLEDLLGDNLKYLKQFAVYPDENERGFSNIIFTPANDEKTIIPFEFYHDIFYLRLPFWCEEIKMHMVSKNYECMDKLLLLKNEDIISYINENNILSQSDALEELILNSDDKCFISMPLNDGIKNLSTIEIDAYHHYINTNKISQDKIGVLDTRTRGFEDGADEEVYRKTYVLNNNITNDNTHEIYKASPVINNNKATSASYASTSYNMKTSKAKNTEKYETIVKYINDKIYIEEYNAKQNNITRLNRLKTGNNYNYIVAKWTRT